MRETILTDGRPSLQVLAFFIVLSVVIVLCFCGMICQWRERRRMLNEYYASERADRLRATPVGELRSERSEYAEQIKGLARAAMGKAYDDDRFLGLTGRAFTSAEESEWERLNQKYDELTDEIGRRDA